MFDSLSCFFLCVFLFAVWNLRTSFKKKRLICEKMFSPPGFFKWVFIIYHDTPIIEALGALKSKGMHYNNAV